MWDILIRKIRKRHKTEVDPVPLGTGSLGRKRGACFDLNGVALNYEANIKFARYITFAHVLKPEDIGLENWFQTGE